MVVMKAFDGGVLIATPDRPLNTVIGQHRMELVGRSLNKMTQELRSYHFSCFWMEPGQHRRGRSVNGHAEIPLALSRLHLCNSDRKAANGAALESFLERLAACGFG